MWLWTRKVSGINFDGTWTRYVCNNVIISILWLASATTRSPSLVFLIPYDFYMQNLLCFASLVINRSLNECWSQGAFVFPSYYLMFLCWTLKTMMWRSLSLATRKSVVTNHAIVMGHYHFNHNPDSIIGLFDSIWFCMQVLLCFASLFINLSLNECWS